MKGWYKESYRHYLAAKGVSTNRYYARDPLKVSRFIESLPIGPPEAGLTESAKRIQAQIESREKYIKGEQAREAERAKLLEKVGRRELTKEEAQARDIYLKLAQRPSQAGLGIEVLQAKLKAQDKTVRKASKERDVAKSKKESLEKMKKSQEDLRQAFYERMVGARKVPEKDPNYAIYGSRIEKLERELADAKAEFDKKDAEYKAALDTYNRTAIRTRQYVLKEKEPGVQ